MPLSAGEKLGAYEILSPLGAGGMGEVYRANDTKLSREVAIKVLTQEFARDPERLARFEREARALASLNHPNIAAIYGLEQTDGVPFLVLELVPGPTLAERLAHDRFEMEEAVDIAKQICEALEAAHEKGLIHRDLKPGNVKVTPEGKVKLLDFGLVKAFTGEEPASDSLSSTRSALPTRAGVILGTPAYMSPEQARGGRVDKRGDIWSFGVVLYEMVTGRQPFAAGTLSDTLAAVLTKELDWSAVPARLRGLIGRCLERDQRRRLRDIGDARLMLEDDTARELAAMPRQSRLPWAVAGLLAAASVVALWAPWRATRPAEQPLMRFTETVGADAELFTGRGVILSPDGMRLVYVSRGGDGNRRLSTRRLQETQATTLAGTEGAMYPFFSPDGQWVAFFAQGKLKKVPAEGGAVITLCEAPNGRGGTWGEDGSIVAAMNNRAGLSRVPSSGGTPTPAIQVNPDNQENSHRWPQWLPGGKAVLFTGGIAGGGTFLSPHLAVWSLETGRTKILQQNGLFGRYLASGHLAYVQEGTLFAAPMDLHRLELTGPPWPVLEDVLYDESFADAVIGFSHAGTLVYLRGKQQGPALTVQWVDAQGKLQPLLPKPGNYSSPRISPDGRRLALALLEGGNTHIWVYEWDQDKMTRLTFSPGVEEAPIWSPDGARIAFRSEKGISLIRTDGSGGAQPVTESKHSQYPQFFTPDGKLLVYEDLSPETGTDIWAAPLPASGATPPRLDKPEVLIRTSYNEGAPELSPDGRWLAYASDESGKAEIYVRPFPLSGSGGKWQVSTGGGEYPVWSRTARELFFRDTKGGILLAGYKVNGDSFVAEKPRAWTARSFYAIGFTRGFDLAPDGRRLAVLIDELTPREKPAAQLTILLNFFDEVRRRERAAGRQAQ